MTTRDDSGRSILRTLSAAVALTLLGLSLRKTGSLPPDFWLLSLEGSVFVVSLMSILKAPVVVAGALNQQYLRGLLRVEMEPFMFLFTIPKGVFLLLQQPLPSLVILCKFMPQKRVRSNPLHLRLENFPSSDKSKSRTLFHHPFFSFHRIISSSDPTSVHLLLSQVYA